MDPELWALYFVLVFLRMAEFCLGFVKKMSFETRSPPFPKIVQHPNKTLLLLHSAHLTSMAFVATGSQTLSFLKFSNSNSTCPVYLTGML